jgi:NADH:ubiquinone oxidoreductase subunit 5 (subunit L)/multisubunit Na+/H+ antiporter MnhA subunit
MGCGFGCPYNDCFYMFRLMFLTFFQEFRGTAEQNTICTKVLLYHSWWFVFTIGVGLFARKQLGWIIIWFHLPKLATAEHHLGLQNISLMAIAVVGGLVGIGLHTNTSNKIQYQLKCAMKNGNKDTDNCHGRV